jgi:phospholipase A1/A2
MTSVRHEKQDNNMTAALGRAMATLVLAGLAPAALAQSGPTALNECHGLERGSDRLACYDRLSGRSGMPGSQPAPAAAVPPAAPGSSAAPQPAGAPASSVVTALDRAWGLDPNSDRYGLSFYRSNYLLIARWTDNVNNTPFSPIFNAAGVPDQQLDSTEAKFQVSGKLRFFSTDDRRWSLYAAYTQQNQWQVYNDSLSRPFRETNYMPELFATWAPQMSFWGIDWKTLSFGYTHQSNGRADPLSRSWDRLFAEGGFESGNLAVFARAWYRIPESDSKDDNPDITDYYGYGEINALYRWRQNSFAASVRGNIATGKGALQVGWFSRPLLGPLRAYVQVFTGYGESMIDYNWRQTTVGAGFALSDGL